MFSEIFVNFIQEKKISSYRVAKETGIDPGTMVQYKNGNRVPSIENLIKIADYLDVSIDYLVGRTDNPEINKNHK